MPTTEQLAVEFRKVVKTYLTAGQLIEVDRLNAVEADKSVCHSHDFCDTNQAMLDAMEVFGMEFEPDNQGQTDLINAAWDIVKQEGFSK